MPMVYTEKTRSRYLLWTEAISDQRCPHRNPCSDETGLEDKVGVCGPNTDVIFIVCLISRWISSLIYRRAGAHHDTDTGTWTRVQSLFSRGWR